MATLEEAKARLAKASQRFHDTEIKWQPSLWDSSDFGLQPQGNDLFGNIFSNIFGTRPLSPPAPRIFSQRDAPRALGSVKRRGRALNAAFARRAGAVAALAAGRRRQQRHVPRRAGAVRRAIALRVDGGQGGGQQCALRRRPLSHWAGAEWPSGSYACEHSTAWLETMLG